MVISPYSPETKHDCAEEGQEQITALLYQYVFVRDFQLIL
jgi:hypothetical protein